VKPISGKKMCRILKKRGWVLVRHKGSHHAFQQPGNPTTLIVPVHGNKDLKPGTQHGIMKDAGLREEDL
jgi:predicted RNA binding protein YcfA (HicA-like mRNA interferase family)